VRLAAFVAGSRCRSRSFTISNTSPFDDGLDREDSDGGVSAGVCWMKPLFVGAS
jgi:hypothetical protein